MKRESQEFPSIRIDGGTGFLHQNRAPVVHERHDNQRRRGDGFLARFTNISAYV